MVRLGNARVWGIQQHKLFWRTVAYRWKLNAAELDVSESRPRLSTLCAVNLAMSSWLAPLVVRQINFCESLDFQALNGLFQAKLSSWPARDTLLSYDASQALTSTRWRARHKNL